MNAATHRYLRRRYDGRAPIFRFPAVRYTTLPEDIRNNAGAIPASGDGAKLSEDKSGNSSTNVLAQNGTNGGGAYVTTGISVGTADFTFLVRATVPLSAPSATVCFGGFSSNNSTFAGVGNRFECQLETTGEVRFVINDGANSNTRTYTTSLVTTYAGQTVSIYFTRTGTTIAAYVNGAAIALTDSGGTALWSSSITSTYLNLGFRTATASLNGNILFSRAYSVALDASQVAADYAGTIQTGNNINCNFATAGKLVSSFTCTTGQTVTIVSGGTATGARISGARDLYQGTAANQSYLLSPGFLLNSSNMANVFSGGGTVTGASATGANLAYAGGGNLPYLASRPDFPIIPGVAYTISFTLVVNSGAPVVLNLTNSGASPISPIVSGLAPATPTAYSYTYTPVAAEASSTGRFTFSPTSNIATDFTVSNLSVTANAQTLHFDGSNDYLKAAAFALAQPVTGYAVCSQVSWTTNDVLFDGNAPTVQIGQPTSTPRLGIPGGSSDTFTDGLAVAATGVLSWVWNGASSAIRVNRTTADTGTGPTTAPNGITIGANGSGTQPANITTQEVLVFPTNHDEIAQQRMARDLMRKNRMPMAA
jgi:hypothetical protein